MKANRVTLLSGETGSGKTTQIPQFLEQDWDLVPEGMQVTTPLNSSPVFVGGGG